MGREFIWRRDFEEARGGDIRRNAFQEALPKIYLEILDPHPANPEWQIPFRPSEFIHLRH
jgi:hypothetical protein